MNVSAAFPLENAGWPALMVNPDGVVLRTNSAAIQVFGSVAYEGKNLSKFWPEKGPALAELFSDKISHTVELRVKEGSAVTFHISVMQFGNFEMKNILLQFFRIEPIKVAPVQPPEQPLAKASPDTAMDANLAHRQKLDCAMQLARSVSLDFKNALTSIIGHSSLLLSKADSEHPWRNSLVEIEKSAERAAEIANDLANFSRQEVTEKRAGNVNELLRQTVDVFRSPENSEIKFSLELEAKLFSAKFDEAKIQQMFAKVLENAVQSISGAGEIVIQSRNCELETPLQERTIRLAAGTYICVEVRDSGVGIPAENLQRVFEPFFTTKGKDSRGLGLTLVYGIITNHGGGVSISSEFGKGTTVQIYLPATKRVVRETASNPDDLWGAESVLVVDDEDLILNMAQMVLSSFGYRPLTASSGAEAINILNHEIVDLVITDLVMPHMSGRELVERIRLISPGVKIICSSGYLRSQNESEDSYLQKPFTAQELLRKVRQAFSAEQTI